MKTKFFIIFCLMFAVKTSFGQQYKDWEEHDVIKFYEKKEIDLDYDTLDEDGEEIYNSNLIFYVPTQIKSGLYEIEVYDKVSSTLWQIKGTNTYMKFRYTPYLYRYDEGVLDVSYGSGTFYKKD